VHSDPVDQHRTRILFYLYSDSVLKNTETGASQRRVDFWPLFTRTREFNGNTRLQVFSVLEPFFAGQQERPARLFTRLVGVALREEPESRQNQPISLLEPVPARYHA